MSMVGKGKKTGTVDMGSDGTRGGDAIGVTARILGLYLVFLVDCRSEHGNKAVMVVIGFLVKVQVLIGQWDFEQGVMGGKICVALSRIGVLSRDVGSGGDGIASGHWCRRAC